MDIVVFALSAIISLSASIVLVSRLERVGERFGASEAMLGLAAALAADGPEITSAVAAISSGHGTIGVGVTLGSNVFNLAALLGLSAVVAGRVGLHRRSIILEGALAITLAFIAVGVVSGGLGPVPGLILGLAAFLPYVAYSALGPGRRPTVGLPDRLSVWLARALAEEESELAIAIHPRRGTARDGLLVVVALVVVVCASVVMEDSGTRLGSAAGLAPILIGALVLAAVTSLPNAVAAIYLASKGRGTAMMSTAFNSNAINMIVGLTVPAAILGLGAPTQDAGFVAFFYLGLTAFAVALALQAKGLNRRSGSAIIAAYVLFVAVLIVG